MTRVLRIHNSLCPHAALLYNSGLTNCSLSTLLDQKTRTVSGMPNWVMRLSVAHFTTASMC
jgi:hypothetical protein